MTASVEACCTGCNCLSAQTTVNIKTMQSGPLGILRHLLDIASRLLGRASLSSCSHCCLLDLVTGDARCLLPWLNNTPQHPATPAALFAGSTRQTAGRNCCVSETLLYLGRPFNVFPQQIVCVSLAASLLGAAPAAVVLLSIQLNHCCRCHRCRCCCSTAPASSCPAPPQPSQMAAGTDGAQMTC